MHLELALRLALIVTRHKASQVGVDKHPVPRIFEPDAGFIEATLRDLRNRCVPGPVVIRTMLHGACPSWPAAA